jgi:hypothetical protein
VLCIVTCVVHADEVHVGAGLGCGAAGL